ncbi:MAG: SCO family protein, partial [Chloroflexota bacterium]
RRMDSRNGMELTKMYINTIYPKMLSIFVFLIVMTACGPGNDAVLNDVSPGVDHPDTAGFRVITREEYDTPQPAFNFELTDQNNQPLTLEDLHGQVVMIGFIYTHCPEACPLVAANFAAVQKEFIGAVDAQNLTQVLVTTDPERDTPERLKRYTNVFGGLWYFLTGTLDEVKTVWDGYDVYWEVKDRNKEVVVFHSYKTYLIDRQGQLRYEFIGVWYPDDIEADIQNLLNE